jgi:small subunit ribosomal protein S16
LLRIRLSRVGKKKQPTYRVVVADSRSPRDGSFLKIIGHYNPLTDPATLVVKEDEAVRWLEKGAKPRTVQTPDAHRRHGASRPAAMRYEGKRPACTEEGAKVVAAPMAEPKAPAAEASRKKRRLSRRRPDRPGDNGATEAEASGDAGYRC